MTKSTSSPPPSQAAKIMMDKHNRKQLMSEAKRLNIEVKRGDSNQVLAEKIIAKMGKRLKISGMIAGAVGLTAAGAILANEHRRRRKRF